jgi:hypothetical protein
MALDLAVPQVAHCYDNCLEPRHLEFLGVELGETSSTMRALAEGPAAKGLEVRLADE